MADEKKSRGFQPGHKLWMRRNPKTGHRPSIFKTPDAFSEACKEYFEWVESNPLFEERLFQHNGEVIAGVVSKPRAMSIRSACLHMGISDETWFNYRKRAEFKEVVSWAEAVIYTQKFEGAVAGLMHPVIIARELGLREQVDNTHSAPGGGPIQYEDMTDAERRSRIMDLLNDDGVKSSSGPIDLGSALGSASAPRGRGKAKPTR